MQVAMTTRFRTNQSSMTQGSQTANNGGKSNRTYKEENVIGEKVSGKIAWKCIHLP